MRITVFQQDKKILIEFNDKNLKEVFIVDKADEFLACIDKFVKKSKINLKSLKKANLVFDSVGLLTERTIRAIMLGLSF